MTDDCNNSELNAKVVGGIEPRGRVYAMFAIVTLACALGSLTQTVMNSMLLGIQASFGTSESVSQWLTTIYMLGIGITVPLVTHLSKRMCVRSLVLLAIALFAIGAFMDFVAPTFLILFLGRIFQSVSTGITMPLITTVAMTRFPPNQTGTAMGISGIALGFAPNIGPLIGGALVDTLGWRSFFVMLLVILALLFLATLIVVRKEETSGADSKLDVLSFVESTLGFGGLLLGFTNAASVGFAALSAWLPIIIGIVFLVAFIVRQKRIENPLINMNIFSSGNYVVSFIVQNCLFASFMGITLILPLFVQNVCGLSALDAGMVFIPATIGAIILNPLAGFLSDRFGARPVIIIGSVFLAAGAVAMVFTNEASPLWLVTLIQTVRAVGVSILIGPSISWGMRNLPSHTMMDGSAFFVTARQACASLGTALMMFLVSLSSLSSAISMDVAYSMAFALSAVFSLVVLSLAIAKVK